MAANCWRCRAISASRSRHRDRWWSIVDSWAAIRSRLAAIRGFDWRICLGDVAGLGLGLQELGVDGFGLGQRAVALGGERLQLGFEDRQPLGKPRPIDQADLRAKLLEAVGVLAVSAGLCRPGCGRCGAGLSTSSTMSESRSRFCSTRSSRRSASIFLALKRLMPAASSKIMRRSRAEDCRRTSTLPCSMTL